MHVYERVHWKSPVAKRLQDPNKQRAAIGIHTDVSSQKLKEGVLALSHVCRPLQTRTRYYNLRWTPKIFVSRNVAAIITKHAAPS